MESEAERAKQKRLMWCFWVSVAVVVGVFLIPVQTVDNGFMKRSYTLWNLISGEGPGDVSIRLPE